MGDLLPEVPEARGFSSTSCSGLLIRAEAAHEKPPPFIGVSGEPESEQRMVAGLEGQFPWALVGPGASLLPHPDYPSPAITCVPHQMRAASLSCSAPLLHRLQV